MSSSAMPKAADGVAGVRIASMPAVEDLLEVALDQRAHLLRLQVVGVVVAGRQHIGADHDAALDLAAEAGGAGLLVHVDDVLARHAQAVADAVIAREVGRRLGRRDDVVGRQRVFGVRQRDVDDLGAGVLQPGDALLPERLDLLRHAVDAVFLRDADLHALDRAGRSPPRSPAPGRSTEVVSFGSTEAIDFSMIAASRTSRAIGPAWSSDEAKATMPQREQRP